MRDAIGGAFTLEVIVVFMVLVNSYLAYSVNYTRAFKVKNAIIDVIENNEGYPANTSINCADAGKDNFSSRFCNAIKSYGYTAKGYPVNDPDCKKTKNPDGLNDLGICIIAHTNVSGQGFDTTTYVGVYYTVYTYINIDLPILGGIFKFMPSVFRITGDTNIIYSSGGKNVFLGE